MRFYAINCLLLASLTMAMANVYTSEPVHAVATQEAAKQAQRVKFAAAAKAVCGGSAWALTDGKNEIVCKRVRTRSAS